MSSMALEETEKKAAKSYHLDRIERGLDEWLVKDQQAGVFSIDREVFTDAELFELEMKYIFEGNWVYAAHESQIPNNNDFYTLQIGRFPIILTRDAQGQFAGFINSCTHRGARLCREKTGNNKFFSCPFHGWTFSNTGELIDVTDETRGGYPDGFDRSEKGLQPVARLESYRGFIFVSLNAEVDSLREFLGGSTQFIDLLVDQSPDGELEVLRGATRYSYNGNWKLTAENGLDGYHVTTTHASYFMTTMRRASGDSSNTTKTIDFSTWDEIPGGSYSFGNGHTVLWSKYANHKDRPNYEILEAFREKYGDVKAQWMNERLRNLLLFPNVFVMDQTSTQLRIIQPVSVNETEVTTYCIAPKNESATARALRIRQYEDFFNASGMATPDDLTEFNNCQYGFAVGGGRRSDISRGAVRWVDGVDELGKEFGIDARKTATAVADEALYLALHEDWIDIMRDAVNREKEALV